MSTMSRNKGKRAERQVIELLQPVVDAAFARFKRPAPILQRNTLQSDRGGYDIVGLSWLALEVKHVEQTSPGLMEQWWEQTRQQAGETKWPVLCYRRNGVAFRVRLIGFVGDYDWRRGCVVDIAMEDFQWILYRRIEHELRLKYHG